MRAARFAIRCFARRALLLPALVAAGGALGGEAGGCVRQAPAEPTRLEGPPPRMEIGWSESDVRGGGGSGPMAIREGGTPLVYLADMAGTYRVVERMGGGGIGGGGERVLAQGRVGPRTIVRVDARNGVVFGRQTLLAGPLPAGRRYAILMVPDGESVSRTGVSQPVKEAPPGAELTTVPGAEAADVEPSGPEPADAGPSGANPPDPAE